VRLDRAALSDDTAGGVRLRLGVEIGFQIVQDAGLAGPEYLLEAASFHRLRIALVICNGPRLDRAQ